MPTIKKALQEGVKPNGAQLADVMPSGFYKVLTPGDLDGIVAYLRSLPPVTNKVRDPVYRMPIHHQVFPGAEKQMSDADMTDKVKRGLYLVTIAHCLECHTPFGPPGSGSTMAARSAKAAVNSVVRGVLSVSRNITPSKVRALATGATPRSSAPSRTACARMAPSSSRRWDIPYYARMTDGDLDAMVAYLRTCRRRSSLATVTILMLRSRTQCGVSKHGRKFGARCHPSRRAFGAPQDEGRCNFTSSCADDRPSRRRCRQARNRR